MIWAIRVVTAIKKRIPQFLFQRVLVVGGTQIKELSRDSLSVVSQGFFPWAATDLLRGFLHEREKGNRAASNVAHFLAGEI